MNNTRLDRIERALDAQAPPADYHPVRLIDDPDPARREAKVRDALEAGYRVVEVVRTAPHRAAPCDTTCPGPAYTEICRNMPPGDSSRG